MRFLHVLGVAGIVAAAPVAAADSRPAEPQTESPAPQQPRPQVEPGNASQGGSAAQPTGPDDERALRMREEDERRATEAKEKMKKKPGYKEDVPSPRAGGASSRSTN